MRVLHPQISLSVARRKSHSSLITPKTGKPRLSLSISISLSLSL